MVWTNIGKNDKEKLGYWEGVSKEKRRQKERWMEKRAAGWERVRQTNSQGHMGKISITQQKYFKTVLKFKAKNKKMNQNDFDYWESYLIKKRRQRKTWAAKRFAEWDKARRKLITANGGLSKKMGPTVLTAERKHSEARQNNRQSG